MRNLHNAVKFDPPHHGTENPLQSIHLSISTSSRDYAFNNNDAWIYGITNGWDDASYTELSERFNWSKQEVERNKRLHQSFIDCWLHIQDK